LTLLRNPALENLDIDAVIKTVQAQLPGMVVERLRPRHPADIFSIWYFGWNEEDSQIALSSLVGWAPYFVITYVDGLAVDERGWANTREDAVERVVNFLKVNHPK
jgi:hypothetical protein